MLALAGLTFVEYNTEPKLGTCEYPQIGIFFPSVVNPGGLQGEELLS